jgi:adenylate cyclase
VRHRRRSQKSFHLPFADLASRTVPKFQRARLDWRYAFLLPIPLLWALLAQGGHLARFENQFIDLRFRLRGEIEAPVKLIYVDVDSRALQKLGERPWNRQQFGDAAEVLMTRGGAKAVGFDFVFSARSHSALVDQRKAGEGNVAFARVVQRHPGIVLAAQYTEGQDVALGGDAPSQLPLLRLGMTDREKNDVPEMPQYPLVGPTWGRVGLIDFDTRYGGDAVPRWVPMFAHTVGPTLYHLSLQLVLQSLGLDEQAVKILEDRIQIVDREGKLVLTIPLREQQLVEVNWFSRWGNEQLNPRVSLADVLGHRDMLAAENPAQRAEAEKYFEWFRDAIVLVGPTDSLLQDLAPTGFERAPVPKVSVHGNTIKTILAGKYLQHTPRWFTFACVFLLTAVVASLAITGGPRGVWFKLTAGLVFVAYAGFAIYVFSTEHLVIPMAAPLAAAFTTSFVGAIWQLVIEEKQKGRIKAMFGTYVAPALVNRMVESGEEPRLGGVEENITAYFSDIQAFSSFSEKLPPTRLVELMNEYLTACTDIVQAEGGTLDKYIGDAVVAMYGAPLALPDHAHRACVAALRVHRRIAELRDKWAREPEKAWPEIVLQLQTRIGLNSGLAVVGNMGSHTRFNYTMMGDTVNLASRMESGAKSWGTYTMCSEATKIACEATEATRVLFRPLGKIVVKGRTTGVPIFELMALKEDATAPMQECIGLFGEALSRYYARDWDGALAKFRESARLEPNQPGKTPGVKTNPSLVYIEKVVPEAIAEPPPEKWDGAYVMTEK